MGKARKLFCDMDGVLVDFDGYMLKHNMTADEIKKKKGAYLEMDPIPGALEAIRKVMDMGFDVWIATKPPTGVGYAYSDKAEWVFKHIPELKNKIIITHHKGLLGDENDILCDDRPHKAFCSEFKGTVIPFENGYHWDEALLQLNCMITNSDKVNGHTSAEWDCIETGIRPVCDALNAIPGVSTVYSCEGHWFDTHPPYVMFDAPNDVAFNIYKLLEDGHLKGILNINWSVNPTFGGTDRDGSLRYIIQHNDYRFHADSWLPWRWLFWYRMNDELKRLANLISTGSNMSQQNAS